MKKVLVALFAATIAAGTATAVSAWGQMKEYITIGEITSANYPGSVTAGFPEVTSGQLLKGTIIASANANSDQALAMFDGNPSTSYYLSETAAWVGLQLDQAYTLTEVRYIPNPEEAAGPAGWFALQGSNDGENWVEIIKMFQDSHGAEYHIFSPQTIEDERYTEAGYKARTDESIHWLDDYGSFSMYRVINNHIGDVELYGNPAPATILDAESASSRNIATPYYTPFITHIRANGEVKNSVDGSLVGTIIGGGGIWNKATWEKAFDNNNKTCFDPCVEGPECWVGMMFDEPYALTEVRLLPKRGVQTDMYDGRFQGSLDGHSWVDLAVTTIEDVPNTQKWIIKEITDTKGYTYFRYVAASDKQSSLAEMLLFGAPAEAAEPFTVDPLIATQYKYTGELYYAAAKNTITDTEISGTPITGKYYYGWIDRDAGVEAAFDGNPTTAYGHIPRMDGPHHWIGLKADTATAAASVKYYNEVDLVRDIYFQGSNDGVNWTDLGVFKTTDARDADGYYNLTVSDTSAAYEYFRLFNETGYSAYDFKIYAASTTTPVETAAPETDAPAVTPVETAPSETSAPETTAPVGTDEPTAPQTFDFGVIAAAVAVVSAAGYALTKKRK